MERFDFNKYLNIEDFNQSLIKSHEYLLTLNEDLSKLANIDSINIFGGVEDVKKNNEAIQNLIKNIDTKNKIDKKLLEIEKLRLSIENIRLKNEQLIIKQTQKNTKETENNTKATQKNTDAKKKLTDAEKEEIKIKELNEKITKSQIGSLEQLRAKKRLYEIQVAKLSAEERNSTEAGKELVANLADVNAQLIAFGKSTNDGRPNVGRYTESILEAANGMNFLGFSIGDNIPFFTMLSGILGKVKEDFKEADTKQSKFAKGTGKVKAGLKGIAAAGAAGAIALWLTKSATASETFKSNLAGLEASLNPVVDYTGKLLNVLYKDLKLAGTGWSELGKNIINTGAEIFGKGKVFETSWKEGFNNVKQAGKDVVNSIKEQDLSLDKLQKKINEAAEEGKKFAVLEFALKKSKNQMEVNVARLEVLRDLESAIGEDATKNFESRKRNQLEALKLNEEIARQSISIAQQEVAIAQGKYDLAAKYGVVATEQAEALKQAKLAQIAAEGEYLNVLRESAQARNQLVSDELEIDLDILIEGYDNYKTINERKIASDKLTFDERQRLINETVKRGDQAYEEQKAVIQKFKDFSIKNDNELINAQLAFLAKKGALSETEKKYRNELNNQLAENNRLIQQSIDFEKLLQVENEAELVQMFKKAGISEVYNTRTLEVIRERRTAIQDLKDAQTGLDDAVIASAENEYKVNNLVLEIIKGQKNKKGELLITDKEYTAQKIELDKKLLESELALLQANKAGGLNDDQKKRILEIKQALSELDSMSKGLELDKSVKSSMPVFDKFFKMISGGLKQNTDDYEFWKTKTQEAVSSTISSITKVYETIQAQRLKELESELSVIQKSKEEKQKQLDEEKALRDEGFANNYEQRELEFQQIQEQEAQKQQAIEEANKKQQAIATATMIANQALTVSELIKAAASAFSAHAGIPFVGVALGLAAAAAIVAGFIGLKNQISGGFHDGTEYVNAPAGRDKLITRVEKGERILTAAQNAEIPNGVKNEDVSGLIRLGLNADNAPIEGTNINFIAGDNEDVVNELIQLREQQMNREELISTPSGLVHVFYRRGKIVKKEITRH